MVRRLPQLSWTQINYFDSSISPVRLAKCYSATVVRRFRKHRSMFNGLRKCHKNTGPHQPNVILPLTGMRCRKTKVIADIAQRAGNVFFVFHKH